jgi:beta-phosphoglucomutase-like phosphatase (HAD superfamily)
MVDAVLLEWEGVLADTRAARRDALRLALAAEGIAHTLSDDDEQIRGLGVHAAACTILRHIGSRDATLGDLLATRAARTFTDTLGRGLLLMPGAAAFVQGLQGRTRVAVVTRASRAETDLVLRMAGLEDAVTTIVSADDVREDAPAAAAYCLALAHLARVRPLREDRVVAVVDSAPSIRAARAAGVRVLAVGAAAHEAIEADAAVDMLADVSAPEMRALLRTAAGGAAP